MKQPLGWQFGSPGHMKSPVVLHTPMTGWFGAAKSPHTIPPSMMEAASRPASSPPTLVAEVVVDSLVDSVVSEAMVDEEALVELPVGLFVATLLVDGLLVDMPVVLMDGLLIDDVITELADGLLLVDAPGAPDDVLLSGPEEAAVEGTAVEVAEKLALDRPVDAPGVPVLDVLGSMEAPLVAVEASVLSKVASTPPSPPGSAVWQQTPMSHA